MSPQQPVEPASVRSVEGRQLPREVTSRLEKEVPQRAPTSRRHFPCRATGETWFSQVSESADWVSKRPLGLDRGTSRWRGRFYHGPFGRGSGVGFFIGSLGNEPLGQGWTSETSLRAGRTRSMRGARGAVRLGQNSALSKVLARIRRIVDS